MSDASRQRILVVEDDPAVRNLVTTALDLHGYDVGRAETGESAVMEAASRNPDLIMLDLGLPISTVSRSSPRFAAGRRCPSSSYPRAPRNSDKIGALDAGADDYLTKPFSVEELLARVRANLRRSGMAGTDETVEASTFDNGPLHINFAAGCASIAGRDSSSHPPSTSCSHCSPKNVGKVLTHTFITHEIWETSWDSDIASLRVFMRTLRKKIEADPSHPSMIQTHVGVGYRMQRL